MAISKGLKRICASCGARFYDFNKRPVICPKCNTEFTGIVKIKTRRSRNVIEDAKVKGAPLDDDSIEVVEEDADTVSLDDLEKEESEDVEEDEVEAGDLDLDELDDEEDEDEDLEEIEDDLDGAPDKD